MRYRSGNLNTALVWIALAVLQVFVGVHRWLHPSFDQGKLWSVLNAVSAVLWTGIGLSYLWLLFWSKVEITDTGVRANRGFRMITFPYGSIVGVRPAQTSSGRHIRNAVELEIANVSPQTYPHDYVILQLRDAQTFVKALANRIPHAEFEPLPS